MNRRVNVTLQPDEIKGLLTLSRREDRDPRRQAARLIRESLIQAGVLTDQGDVLTDQMNEAAGVEPATAGTAT